jgi:hypothetical protein
MCVRPVNGPALHRSQAENKQCCPHSLNERKMNSPLDSDEAPLQLRPDRRNSGKGQWSESEDLMLMKLVRDNQGKNWKQVAEHFVGRTDVQCLHRWQKVRAAVFMPLCKRPH